MLHWNTDTIVTGTKGVVTVVWSFIIVTVFESIFADRYTQQIRARQFSSAHKIIRSYSSAANKFHQIIFSSGACFQPVTLRMCATWTAIWLSLLAEIPWLWRTYRELPVWPLGIVRETCTREPAISFFRACRPRSEVGEACPVLVFPHLPPPTRHP